jgi:hypothetical protein
MRYKLLVYSFLYCFLGSMLYSYFFLSDLTAFQVYYQDYFILTIVFFLISIVAISPYVLFCNIMFFKKKNMNIFRIRIGMNLAFLLIISITFAVSFNMMKSLMEALELCFSYAIPGVIIINLFISRIQLSNRF